MQADFLDAHERHWDDAHRLFSAERYANADHLFGLAAECGLKRLMVIFGMAVNPETGTPSNEKDRRHVSELWARFESCRNGKVEGVDYGLPTPNPFGNWNVSDRYAHQSNFSHASVQLHREGAAVVCELVKKAQREGLLI